MNFEWEDPRGKMYEISTLSSSGERDTNFRRENGNWKMKSEKMLHFPRDDTQGKDTRVSHENIIFFPPG